MVDSYSDPVKESIDKLSQSWQIDPRIYDLHIGARDDIVDTKVPVNGVVFHIPTLSRDQLFVLWRCLWPECHNCCDRQGRLPLTKDDIELLTTKLGHKSKTEFLKLETRTSHWQEEQSLGTLITTLTMISLKRQQNETDNDDGKPMKCRFLENNGSCTIHPSKPGVCWLYPFSSWLESDSGGRLVTHAAYQFTGDCPGFYVDSSIDSALPILREYSGRIFDYNMAVSRTTRENYGFINFVVTKPGFQTPTKS